MNTNINLDGFAASFKDLCKRSEGLRPEKVRPRTARLVAKLVGNFDQAKGATVRVVPTDKDFLVSVRPKGRKREYSLLLSELARIIITRVVLAEKER